MLTEVSVSDLEFFVVAIPRCNQYDSATYDQTGAVDYLDVFNKSLEAYGNLTVSAGERQ